MYPRCWLLLCLLSLPGCGVGLCAIPLTCAWVALDKTLTLSGVEMDAGSVEIRWPTIEEKLTAADPLNYRVYTSATEALTSVEEILAKGTLVAEQVGISSARFSLPVTQDYTFAVVVSDRYGNQRAYNSRGSFCGGDGTSANPYQVCDVGALQYMQLHRASHFALTKDIDASGTAAWNSGTGFLPVGNCGSDTCGTSLLADAFTGSFRSAGTSPFTVIGLTIARPNRDGVGLFGLVGSGAVFENFALRKLNITGDDGVGGVMGWTPYTAGVGLIVTISKVTVSGTVTGDWYVGGVAGGHYYDGSLWNELVAENIEVVATRDEIGGIIGYAMGHTGCFNCRMQYCHSSGSVQGRDDVGGLVGIIYDGTIRDSSSMATIITLSDGGGIVGQTYGSTAVLQRVAYSGAITGYNFLGGIAGDAKANIIDSYAFGTVSGGQQLGGIAGVMFGGIISSFASVQISCADGVLCGALAGSKSGTASSQSYWNSDVSGESDGYGNSGTLSVAGQYEPRTTNALRTPSTFSTWDFTTPIWKFPTAGGFPQLAWEP